MDILIHKDPPQALIRIVNKLYSTVQSIKKVIFDANIGFLHGKMAVFVPDTGSILIDLAACAKDIRWVKKGSLYVPNVWFNMLYCVYHEYAHAKQVLIDGWETVEECVLESAADREAIELMVEWSEEGCIPKLKEMGWVIGVIRDTINHMYVTNAKQIDAEIDALDTGACALATVATQLSSVYKDLSEDEKSYYITNLKLCVQEGDIGMVIKNQAYLNVTEFFGVDDHCYLNEEVI